MKKTLKIAFILVEVSSLLILLIPFLISSCKKDVAVKTVLSVDNIQLVIPAGWQNPIYDFSANPLTTAGFIIGRKLFYVTKLSSGN
jgi:cytochrome c peroxidase